MVPIGKPQSFILRTNAPRFGGAQRVTARYGTRLLAEAKGFLPGFCCAGAYGREDTSKVLQNYLETNEEFARADRKSASSYCTVAIRPVGGAGKAALAPD